MDIKLLPTGYWHVQLNPQQFAQFPKDSPCLLEHCFPSDWWSQYEIDKVNVAIEAKKALYANG